MKRKHRVMVEITFERPTKVKDAVAAVREFIDEGIPCVSNTAAGYNVEWDEVTKFACKDGERAVRALARQAIPALRTARELEQQKIREDRRLWRGPFDGTMINATEVMRHGTGEVYRAVSGARCIDRAKRDCAWPSAGVQVKFIVTPKPTMMFEALQRKDM